MAITWKCDDKAVTYENKAVLQRTGSSHALALQWATILG